MTHTSDSYQTVPEISESIEEPVAIPLEQKTPKKPMIDINTMSSSINKMDIDETERKGELKLNQPKPFTGKREDLKKFLQDINLYLHVNDKVYNDDIKKISFALSFMNDGDAASWKEQLLEEAMKKDPINLGTWSEFKKDLKTAFQPYDAPGDALEEMKALHMGNGSIEEHNTQFKMAITKSELDSASESPSTSPSNDEFFHSKTHLKPYKNGTTGQQNSITIGEECKRS